MEQTQNNLVLDPKAIYSLKERLANSKMQSTMQGTRSTAEQDDESSTALMTNLGTSFGFNKTLIILPRRNSNAAPMNPDINKIIESSAQMKHLQAGSSCLGQETFKMMK